MPKATRSRKTETHSLPHASAKAFKTGPKPARPASYSLAAIMADDARLLAALRAVLASLRVRVTHRPA